MPTPLLSWDEILDLYPTTQKPNPLGLYGITFPDSIHVPYRHRVYDVIRALINEVARERERADEADEAVEEGQRTAEGDLEVLRDVLEIDVPHIVGGPALVTSVRERVEALLDERDDLAATIHEVESERDDLAATIHELKSGRDALSARIHQLESERDRDLDDERAAIVTEHLPTAWDRLLSATADLDQG